MGLSLGSIGAAVGGFFGGPTGAAIGKAGGDWLGENSGDLISSGASIYNANQTRDFNAEQANLSRESQLELANTQYQRTVKDLNAAGLSPMLAYSKGASPMPSAVTASSNVTADAPRFGETSQRNAAAALAREQVNLAESQRLVNIQTAKQVAEQARKTAYEVDTMLPTQLLYDMALKGSQINSNTAGARNTNALAGLTEEGKAPSSDSTITRTAKDVWKFGVENPNKFFENMIGNVRNYMKGRK
jgi:hypothetical protein